jgi:transposase
MTEKNERRKFTAEFKRGAVDLVVRQGMRKSQVARDLGIRANLLGRWVKDFEEVGKEAFPGNGKLSPQDERIRQLEKECQQLRMERDLLKKATAYFASHGR